MKTVLMRSKWECTPCGNIISVQENNRTKRDTVKCSCNANTFMLHREVIGVE